MRVAFAANDERTAKRISDALGTATEMRDSTNYAGHRLICGLQPTLTSGLWLRRFQTLTGNAEFDNPRVLTLCEPVGSPRLNSAADHPTF